MNAILGDDGQPLTEANADVVSKTDDVGGTGDFVLKSELMVLSGEQAGKGAMRASFKGASNARDFQDHVKAVGTVAAEIFLHRCTPAQILSSATLDSACRTYQESFRLGFELEVQSRRKTLGGK